MPCLLLVAALTGCGRKTGVDPHLDQAYPDKLSGWNLFKAALTPNEGVITYDVNTPLFSDYAHKRRTVWMPPGKQAQYRANGPLDFPAGTILTKTFSYPQRDGTEQFIETRLLVRQASGWIDLVYLWNRDQTDATLETAPAPVPVRWVDGAGRERSTEYVIPNVNQCTACHPNGEPLGPVARNLRLEQWTHAGYLAGAPAQTPRPVVWDDPGTGTLDERARAYLDVNCNSCHREGTRAKPLDLRNRSEFAARMESLDPKKAMPAIGRTVVHAEGVRLIREWVDGDTK